MQLTLERVSKVVASETHLHPLDLTLQPGAVNVVLGATLAGKTTLLRLMAGLDRPSGGRVLVDGKDVTGVSVRRRDLAMVYQQFINYPSLTVFENIASPLRIARRPEREIRERVGRIAETLRLAPLLGRRPAELSGGQQQRTAIARALAKDAGLLLLDEPLGNLDYKLREELRLELGALFESGRRGTTVVYATTLPQEALQLGGHTSVLFQGRLLQQGPTLQVFAAPSSMEVARAFSDPPINFLPAAWDAGSGAVAIGGVGDAGGESLALSLPAQAQARLPEAERGGFYLGVRAHHLRLQRQRPADVALRARVDLAEIDGSETFVHVRRGPLTLVLQVPGVSPLELGSDCTVYLDPAQLFGFARDGALLFAPAGEV
jgi:glycerol transport system ATP-binding protein